jgi:thiol-disulfide isomerase/thioredoxin
MMVFEKINWYFLFYFFFLPQLLFSQDSLIDLTDIASINNLYFRETNQVINIKYFSKTRNKTNSFSKNSLIYLENIEGDSPSISYFETESRLYSKIKDDNYYYKIYDSLNFNEEKIDTKFNIKKRRIPNQINYITYLPLSENDFIDSKNYTSKPEIIYMNINTITLQQHSKKLNQNRIIYINKDRHIIKVEYFNLDSNLLQEKYSLEFFIYKNSTLFQIADSLNFGPFDSNLLNYKYIPKVESLLKYDSGLNLPLTYENILTIDTSKIKYIIIDLWYIGCKPCYQLRSELEKINSNINSNKVILLGYSEYDSASDINAYLKKKNFKIQEISNTFYRKILHADARPTVLILDNQFNVIQHFEGSGKSTIFGIKMFLFQKKLLK